MTMRASQLSKLTIIISSTLMLSFPSLALAMGCTNASIVHRIEGEVFVKRQATNSFAPLNLGDVLCDEDDLRWKNARDSVTTKLKETGDIIKIVPKHIGLLDFFLQIFTIGLGVAMAAFLAWRAYIVSKCNYISKVALYIGSIILGYELFLFINSLN